MQFYNFFKMLCGRWGTEAESGQQSYGEMMLVRCRAARSSPSLPPTLKWMLRRRRPYSTGETDSLATPSYATRFSAICNPYKTQANRAKVGLPHSVNVTWWFRHRYGCEVLWSACLSVRFSVQSHISKTTCPNLARFFVHVTCGRGSVLVWRQCDTVRTSGFVNDVKFPYNGGNRPKSNTVAYVSSSSPGGSACRTSDNVVWSRLPDGGSGGEVCRLRLHLVVTRKPSLAVTPTSLETFFSKIVNFDLHLWVWPGYCQGKLVCRISKSKVVYFRYTQT